MVLFAHFSDHQRRDLGSLVKELEIQAKWPLHLGDNGDRASSRSDSLDTGTRSEPTLLTITLDLDDSNQTHLDTFRLYMAALQNSGLVPVDDYGLFHDPVKFDDSLYWRVIYDFIDSCKPRVLHHGDSLTSIIDKRTGQAVMVNPPRNKDFNLYEVNIENSSTPSEISLTDLVKLRGNHELLLGYLAKFIQYVEVFKRAGRNPDMKVAAHIDEIIGLCYELLARPKDHEDFTAFVRDTVERDDAEGRPIYHTLDLIHDSITLLKGELVKPNSNIPAVLGELQSNGRSYAIASRVGQLANRYDLRAANIEQLVASRYSESGLLQALVNIQTSTSGVDPNLNKILTLMLQYGNFGMYLRSQEGMLARQVATRIGELGFNADFFTRDNLAPDVLSRERSDLVGWQSNFQDLIELFRNPTYNVFFVMRYDGQERLNQDLKRKVLSLHDADSNHGMSYVLNKVKGMLIHCRTKIEEKQQAGKKADQPLLDLEDRLENLEIQLEFGGRPTGGRLYSRVWHRTIEDFSREDFVLCCAALGGDKQDLTFKAIYNPTYVYLEHFIEGISPQLGFSILKAGTVDGKRSLLSISPYEANPAMRTALGEAETYRYVLDSMVKAAYDANAEFLLIDDIDLKVRDDKSNIVRIKDGKTIRLGEPEYESAEAIFVRYRNGEPCAPRSFRKHMQKASKRLKSISYVDINFNQIEGDNELVQEQFGEGSYHYSIQSARARFDPQFDYNMFPVDQTKPIFDNGYNTQNGLRTVFRIDINQYIKERQQEAVNIVNPT